MLVTDNVTSSLPSEQMRTNNQSRLASSKVIFGAGLIISPYAVLNFTTQTTYKVSNLGIA